MKLVPPYVTRNKEITTEAKGSSLDSVERSGYVSPDRKIQSFIDSGQLLQDYRGCSEEYDLEGGESDFDADSPEFADELTADADKFEGEVLPQFIDKISANELIDDYIKSSSSQELAKEAESKKRSEAKTKEENLLSNLVDNISKKVIDSAAAEPNSKPTE